MDGRQRQPISETERQGPPYSNRVQTVELISLPATPYVECHQLQQECRARCRESGIGTVIFVEHPPVITLGRRGDRKALLDSPEALREAGIDLVHSDRGGDITFHGPGQLVAYPILDLKLWRRDVHRYIRTLEEATLQVLSSLGVEAHRSELGSGVWARHPQGSSRKIASVGIHLARWISSHGVALNVSNSLEPFRHIAPCGLNGVKMTSISELLGRDVLRSEVEASLETQLLRCFDLIPISQTC